MKKLSSLFEHPRGSANIERIETRPIELFDMDKEVRQGVVAKQDAETAWDFLMVNDNIIDAMYKRYSQISTSKIKSELF